MAVLEHIDSADWHTREVYAYFGRAMHAAQLLEHGIINLVVWTGVRDATLRTWNETQHEEDRLIRQTMGKLKKTLAERRSDIDHLDDLLIQAVKLRNFLAHEYFRQRAAAFLTEDGRNQMIEELDKAASFLQDVDSKLSPLTREIIAGKGIDLAEDMERARQAGFGDPLPGLSG